MAQKDVKVFPNESKLEVCLWSNAASPQKLHISGAEPNHQFVKNLFGKKK